MYIVEILRYGKETLGRHLFGVFDDLEKAVNDAKDYNCYRGGKYPKIIVTKTKLNESTPFEYEKNIVDL